MQLVTGTNPLETTPATFAASTPRRERQRERRAELLAESHAESQREDVQRLAGEIRLLARHEVARVGDDERVRDLEPEAEAEARGLGREVLRDRDGAVPVQVLVERGLSDRDPRVAEPPVQDLLDFLVSEQRRVELHDRVKTSLEKQVAPDRVDLVGRTAVERRKRDRVRQPGRARHVGEATEGSRELAAQRGAFLVENRARVPDAVEKRGHLRRTDTLEVIADGDVEERRRARSGEYRKARRGSRRGTEPSRIHAGIARLRAPATIPH